MATRLFLTLLALLTGLAAQIAPTQARVCAERTAAVALVSPVVPRLAAAPAELARLPEPGWRHARMVASAQPGFAVPTLRATGVRVGIDRARE